jgi:translation initiation factor 5B
VILAFDVKIAKEAQEVADEMGVRIFTAQIIYHLFDQFTDYMKKIESGKKEEAVAEVNFHDDDAQILFYCLIGCVSMQA